MWDRTQTDRQSNSRRPSALRAVGLEKNESGVQGTDQGTYMTLGSCQIKTNNVRFTIINSMATYI